MSTLSNLSPGVTDKMTEHNHDDGETLYEKIQNKIDELTKKRKSLTVGTVVYAASNWIDALEWVKSLMNLEDCL